VRTAIRSLKLGLTTMWGWFHPPPQAKTSALWFFAAAFIVIAIVVPLPLQHQNARLEIIEGDLRTKLPVRKGLASITYARRSGEVEIRLIDPAGRGVPQTVRLLSSDRDIAEQVSHLIVETQELRVAAGNRLAQIRTLQAMMNLLLERTSTAARRTQAGVKQSTLPSSDIENPR